MWIRGLVLATVVLGAACGGAMEELAAGAGGKADDVNSVAKDRAIKSVFVILMENHDWSDIKGNDEAPYLNGLLATGAHAENYYNPPNNHPSLTNYIWLEAGDNLGITNDKDPSRNHRETTEHLVTQLNNAGVSWKSYQEDIDGNSCPTKSSGLYRAKHNPMVYFDDVTSDEEYCKAHIRPYSELATDLANGTVAQYNFITPNLCHDMHGSLGVGFFQFTFQCLTDLVEKGDTWLSQEVPTILRSDVFKRGGALFITWDESEHGDDPIGMIALSPFAKTNYANTIPYTHSSTLRTVQEVLGVGPFLRGAADATSLSDLFTTYP